MTFIIKSEKSSSLSFILVEAEKNECYNELDGGWISKSLKSCSSLEEAKIQARLLGLIDVKDVSNDKRMSADIEHGMIISDINDCLEKLMRSFGIPQSFWNHKPSRCYV